MPITTPTAVRLTTSPSRRGLLTGTGAVALLAACGSGDGASTPTGAVTAAGSTPAQATTATVEHALGTAEVPVDPRRIAVVGRRGTFAILLDLGLEPVGALDATFVLGQPFHPLVQEEADAAGTQPIALADAGPSVEQVAGLTPDLIIGAAVDLEDVYPELQAIAPTVGIDWDFVDPLANVRAVGAAVGRAAEAEEMAAAFDAEVEERAAEVAASGTVSIGTVSIAGLFAPDDLRVYRSGNLVASIAGRLGAQVVPTEEELPLDPADPVLSDISLEQLGLLDGDRLISFVNLGEENDATYRDLLTLPVVQAVPAIASGQVLELDPQLAFGTAGMEGLRVLLDEVAGFLAS